MMNAESEFAVPVPNGLSWVSVQFEPVVPVEAANGVRNESVPPVPGVTASVVTFVPEHIGVPPARPFISPIRTGTVDVPEVDGTVSVIAGGVPRGSPRQLTIGDVVMTARRP